MQPFLLHSNTLLQIKQVKFIHNAFSKISLQQWSTLFEPKGELYSVYEHSEKYPIISVIHSINLQKDDLSIACATILVAQ